jgi:hypothetical protein
MARLIEIDGPIADLIILQTGDLLVIAASGGKVNSGHDVVEVLGPFYPGIMTPTGEIIEPAGSPGKVMFLARGAGSASIETFWGDSWTTPKIITTSVTVKR